MFDLTQSPEFMAALEKALVVCANNAQIVTPGIDPENEWLTAREAMEFLRLKESAFKRFRDRYEKDLVWSIGVGETEVRYQLASLQKIMRKAAVGLPSELPAAAAPVPAFRRSANHGRNGHAKTKVPAGDRHLESTLFP